LRLLEETALHPGEPIVFRRLHRPFDGAYLIIGVLVTMVALMIGMKSPTMLATFVGYSVILGSVAAAHAFGAAMESLSPTYFRVSPGKLEVLHGRWRSSAVKLARSVDLTSASLVIRFDKRWVRIESKRNIPCRETIALDGILAPHAFAKAIAWGVLAQHPAGIPRLSRDSLVG
jgi:hypothetical protein